MNKKAPLQLSSFRGTQSPSSPSMCFPSPKNEKRDHHPGLCGCQRAPKSHCISAIGVLVLVLAYTAMGSIIFMSLEGETEDNSMETAVAASKPYPRTDLVNADIRSRTVDRLWSITEDLNILYKENWTRLAAQEVQHFQDTLLRAVRASKIQQPGAQPIMPSHKWSYASAFLYSLTLITTIGGGPAKNKKDDVFHLRIISLIKTSAIGLYNRFDSDNVEASGSEDVTDLIVEGYGGISPRTQWGRIAALIYALFGIPIVLLYLSAMGEGLSTAMRCLFRKTRTSSSRSGNKTPPSDGAGSNSSSSGSHHMHHPNAKIHNIYQIARSPSIPISICVMILICYITLGAVLFHKIQDWGVLESLYFCFTSLGTIGFGDLAPTGNLSQYLASGYILIGMAVVAMCFSLIQTELILWLRKFGMQDQVLSPSEDVALVSVSVTPKS